MAAKTIATASVMSQGRLTVGIGAGWMREEFDLLGVPFAGRGKRMVEALTAMRTLWSGGMVEHHGEFFDFDPIQMSPVPPAKIPIYGGGVSEVALRRAATMCDGWASEIQTSSEVEEISARLQRYREGSDLAGEAFGMCVASKDAHDLPGYRRMAELGVTELITVPWLFYGAEESSCSEKCDGIRRFGEDVISNLKPS